MKPTPESLEAAYQRHLTTTALATTPSTMAWQAGYNTLREIMSVSQVFALMRAQLPDDAHLTFHLSRRLADPLTRVHIWSAVCETFQ